MVAVGPHFHIAIVPPPALAGTKAVVPAASENGVKTIELAVADVDPPRFVTLATTVMSPAVPTDPEATYFVAVKVHGAAASAATMLGVVDDCTSSVIAVRHDDAARITSDALARTV